MKILVCDRCGFQITERYDIYLAMEGSKAWHDSVRAGGEEPRGVFPCKYHMNCKGEMVLQKKKHKLFGR